MRAKKNFVVGIAAISAVLLNIGLGYAQDSPQIKTAPAGEETSKQESANSPDIQWLWGEVVSVDMANQQLAVKYFDYEADTEKDITIGIDNKTTYENIKALEEIKPLDTISIDYVSAPDGKNIAKNISVEKPENTEAAPKPEVTENTPEQAPAVKQ